MTKLLRAVGEGDAETVSNLFQEHGRQLSVEARDKYGKTLLMVHIRSQFLNQRWLHKMDTRR